MSLEAAPADDGRVELRLADTGPGIPPEALPRLFEPFNTTKPVGEGPGLGLAVTHGLMRAMEATIEPLPSPAGATFLLRFQPAGLIGTKKLFGGGAAGG